MDHYCVSVANPASRMSPPSSPLMHSSRVVPVRPMNEGRVRTHRRVNRVAGDMVGMGVRRRIGGIVEGVDGHIYEDLRRLPLALLRFGFRLKQIAGGGAKSLTNLFAGWSHQRTESAPRDRK